MNNAHIHPNATRFLPQRRYVVGSPVYLKNYGVPQAPDELNGHVALLYDYGVGQNKWRFAKPDNIEDVEEILLEGRMRTNNSEALLSVAKHGLGLPFYRTGL